MTTMVDLQSVEAALQYVAPGKDTKHVRKVMSDSPANADWRIVSIFDARPIAKTLSLDWEGFALVKSRSAVTDFYNPLEVRTVYYREVEALVRQATGATKT